VLIAEYDNLQNILTAAHVVPNTSEQHLGCYVIFDFNKNA
jgi:hypothetical protein